MSSETLTTVPRKIRGEVDRGASQIWDKTLDALRDKPGYVELRRRIHVGVEGFLRFNSDLGEFMATFNPSAEARTFTLVRSWEDANGSHQQSVDGIAENRFLFFPKTYDLSWLRYKREDGSPVLGVNAIPESLRLVNTLRRAKPILPTEISPAIFAN